MAGGGPYNVTATLDEILQRIREENALLGGADKPRIFEADGATACVPRSAMRCWMNCWAVARMWLFTHAMIDSYLADNVAAMERKAMCYDWKPMVPIRFFHGRDDQTVSYKSATATLLAMQNRGAGSLVSLTDCQRVPAGHLECVPPFWQFVVAQLAAVARDL